MKKYSPPGKPSDRYDLKLDDRGDYAIFIPHLLSVDLHGVIRERGAFVGDAQRRSPTGDSPLRIQRHRMSPVIYRCVSRLRDHRRLCCHLHHHVPRLRCHLLHLVRILSVAALSTIPMGSLSCAREKREKIPSPPPVVLG